MSITIELQPEVEKGLLARAHARGVSLADYAREVLAREARSAAAPSAGAHEAKNLFDLFTPVRGLLTDEEVDTVFARNPSTGRPVDLR